MMHINITVHVTTNKLTCINQPNSKPWATKWLIETYNTSSLTKKWETQKNSWRVVTLLTLKLGKGGKGKKEKQN